MSGHSKWKNNLHKKEKSDSQRGKIFTKLSREIIVAVKEGGGPDPNANSRLKDVIAKAKASNLPNDNIKRLIEKAAGGGDGANYETIAYEGYGPNGIAIIVDALTDNRNRTASEMRHYFDKFGGNLGAAGCVSWSFDQKGVIVIDREDYDEDDILAESLEAGADDLRSDGEVFEIYTKPGDFSSVAEIFGKKGYTLLSAEVEMVPRSYISLTNEDDIKNMQKLLDAIEENDDVQNVYHNWEE